MIVPQTRLLLWAALVLVPFGTLAGMETPARPFAWLIVSAFIAVTIVDLLLAPRRTRSLGLELPDVTRVSKDRNAELPVRIHNPSLTSVVARITLQMPSGLRSSSDELRIAVPADVEWTQVKWPIRPDTRGKFTIPSARIETLSPLQLWGSWSNIPVTGEVRVYPNLLTDRKSLAGLLLNRGIGLHSQRMIGKGRDFEKLRDYVPGDSYDEIHWKATAKRGQPVTKVFQMERTQEIYVIVDASRLSARNASRDVLSHDTSANPSRPGTLEPTIERFITSALLLGIAAEKQGDLFGLLTFSDRVETFVRARNGKGHYHTCRDALYTLKAKDVTPDFEELSTFIRMRLRRRALLLFLTSLDDPVLAETFVRSMDLLSRQHLVVVNTLKPNGTEPLFSVPADTDETLYDALAGHTRWHNLRELEKVLQRRGVRFSVLDQGDLTSGLVAQYLNIKQRQAL